jgi:hypothetical protein
MIKTFYNFFTIPLSCPSSFYCISMSTSYFTIYINASRNVLICSTCNRICIWLRTCDCVLKDWLHFNAIFGEKIDGWIVTYTRPVMQLYPLRQLTWVGAWSFSCQILYFKKIFLPITTAKANPSKHYKHVRKAFAFAFRKLELCRHCRFMAG